MLNRVVGSGGTVYNDVANLVFTEQVNTEMRLTPGAVCADCIQFDLYTQHGESISEGDVLSYYQVDDQNNATLMGVFNVSVVEQRRAKQVITAYDNIVKLDVDFSSKLAQLQGSFPIAANGMVRAACEAAGIEWDGVNFPLYNIKFKQFYTDRITCRQIISWVAEIACCFVNCTTDGKLSIRWYTENTDYQIYPTGGSPGYESYIYYKMNGLAYSGEVDPSIDNVKINLSNQAGGSYYYPTPYSQIYAEDTTGQGNLELFNMLATDTGDETFGDIYLSNPVLYTFDTSGDGDLSVMEEESASITYAITDNLLLENATDDTKMYVAQHIYDTINAFPVYRDTQVDLFMFNNPFHAGEIVRLTDILGTSFVFPVMKLEYGRGAARLSTDNLNIGG